MNAAVAEPNPPGTTDSPALGYYEWRKTDGGTVPYFLHDPDGRLLMFAGLYEVWRDPALPDDDPDGRLWTCTIITQAATDLLSQIHDRNPVVLPADLHDDWLDCSRGDLGYGAPSSRSDAGSAPRALRCLDRRQQRGQQRSRADRTGQPAGSPWQLRLEL